MRLNRYYLTAILIAFYLIAAGQQQKPLPLIPEPALVRPTNESFKLDRNVIIKYNDKDGEKIAGLLNEFISSKYGFRLKQNATVKSGIKQIIITSSTSVNPESYSLTINHSTIKLSGDVAGIFYGLQTLQQLCPLKPAASISLPGVNIQDSPRFAYRGLMLDVSRHFFPVSYIKKFIDVMAYYKFNNFHWHLTDDQGWRIEIKRYPKLQETGAWRTPTALEDNSPQIKNGRYGGYYTQQEIKDVVAYASARHINIVPEIEMPGHSGAALAAYPQLGCTGGPYNVLTSGGINKNVYCAGNDEVFTFLQNVIDEVVALFPGKYIHIGGDETPKDSWRVCPKCQARIKAEGLKDEFGLQSYFVQRMEKYINSKGKQIIGWDEILEGGLAPNATVMSWRGEVGGIEAARQHHDVIMTPYHYLYLDYTQGRHQELEPYANSAYLPLSKVYSYDPVPPMLTEDEKQYIKGVQANTWAEQIPNEAHADYMVYPRALAAAEVGWSPKGKKNYSDFLKRLPENLALLDERHINFRIPEPQDLTDSITTSNLITLNLKPLVQGAVVYYTTDGSMPSTSSSRAIKPISLTLTDNVPVNVKAMTVLVSGRQSAAYIATYEKKTMLPATQIGKLQPGLSFKAASGDKGTAKTLNLKQADTTGTISSFSLAPFTAKSKFAVVYTGYFLADTDDIYKFKVNSDDGAALYLDDELVIDNDGQHPPVEKSGAVPLKKGYHKIRLQYFDGGGGKALNVSTMKNGRLYPLENRLYN